MTEKVNSNLMLKGINKDIEKRNTLQSLIDTGTVTISSNSLKYLINCARSIDNPNVGNNSTLYNEGYEDGIIMTTKKELIGLYRILNELPKKYQPAVDDHLVTSIETLTAFLKSKNVDINELQKEYNVRPNRTFFRQTRI